MRIVIKKYDGYRKRLSLQQGNVQALACTLGTDIFHGFSAVDKIDFRLPVLNSSDLSVETSTSLITHRASRVPLLPQTSAISLNRRIVDLVAAAAGVLESPHRQVLFPQNFRILSETRTIRSKLHQQQSSCTICRTKCRPNAASPLSFHKTCTYIVRVGIFPSS